jgi:hypothetical protein
MQALARVMDDVSRRSPGVLLAAPGAQVAAAGDRVLLTPQRRAGRRLPRVRSLGARQLPDGASTFALALRGLRPAATAWRSAAPAARRGTRP